MFIYIYVYIYKLCVYMYVRMDVCACIWSNIKLFLPGLYFLKVKNRNYGSVK